MVLAEAVDDDAVLLVLERTNDAAPRQRQPMIDLIGNEANFVPRAPATDGLHRLLPQHRARWVGRRRHYQPVDWLAVPLHRVVEHLRRGLPVALLCRWDRHYLAPQRLQDISVAGVAWCGHRHATARVEQRREGDDKAPGAPRRHNHVGCVDLLAVSLHVQVRNLLAQGRYAEGARVRDPVIKDSFARGLQYLPRRPDARLPDVQGNDPLLGSRLGESLVLQGGVPDHLHDLEARDL
mmetsp:Transcript_42259/g.103572  ORF Transcript_42259/g.103572 Transcript_42259/m.103572 type:complete len:237 (-) Transcript_42259:84-794(-)